MAGWLIASGDFVTTGGMDAANWHLASHLAKTGPVELVSHRVDPQLAAMVNIHVTPVRRPFGKHTLGEPFLRSRAMARSRDVLSRGGFAVANGGNAAIPDVNWVHYVHAAYSPLTAGSPLRRAKARFDRWRYCNAERQSLENARIIICNSKLTQKHVTQSVGIPTVKTRVVYYGCDPERLKPVSAEDRRAARAMLGWDDRPWAVFIGALGDRRKGFDTLFEAWRLACERPEWDANLAVIGRGAEQQAWQERARAAGLASRISFLGFRKDVPEVLAACDLLIHPARYEAYGLGVHEALCRGLPAIVSSQAGVAEQMGDALAELILMKADDAGELVERMRHWRTNLESLKARVEPLSQRLRARTWSHMAAEFVQYATAK